MAELLCVDPALVDRVWPAVSHHIRQAMKRGDLGTFKSVETDVLAGNNLLWLVVTGGKIDAALVTSLTLTDTKKVCTIVALGGSEPQRWIRLISEIEKYATDEGCDCVRIMGRKGWSRLLPEYKQARIVLDKDLR